MRDKNVKRGVPLIRISRWDNRFSQWIGFFIYFPKLHHILILCFLLVLLSPIVVFSQPKHTYPPWYDKNTKQVDGGKNPAELAETSDPFSTVGRWRWGACFSAAAVGNYAYIGNGRLFQVLDITDSSSPVVLGEIPLSYVYDVKVQGSYAFVAGGDFFVIEITDPSKPKVVSTLDLSMAMRVEVADSLAYIGDFGAIRIIDISTPRTPYLRSSYATVEWPLGISLHEPYLYVADIDLHTLYALDVSDPDNPIFVNDLIFGWITSSLTSDSHLFIGMETGGNYSLGIFDISDPVNPIQTGEAIIGQSFEQEIYSIALDGDVAYISTLDSGFYSIDVSDLSQPVIRGHYKWPFTTFFWSRPGTHGLPIVGSRLLVPINVGLSVIDISNPDSLSEVSMFFTGGVHTSVAIRDSVAFLGAGISGLWILDVTDPTHPQPISNEFFPSGYTVDVQITDSLAFVLNWEEYPWYHDGRGLWILDISDIQNPQVISHYTGITRYSPDVQQNRMVKDGDLIYLTQARTGSNDSTFEIIDVSDPVNPTNLSVYRSSIVPSGIAFADSVAFISTQDDGIKIIDCTDPVDPTEISSLFSYGVAVSILGSHLFVARGDSFFIVDVSSPVSPSVIGAMPFPFGWLSAYAYLLPIGNDVYWAADQSEGIIDVSTPTNPQIIAFHSGGSSDVAVDGTKLFFPNIYYGLWIAQDNRTLQGQDYNIKAGWNLISIPLTVAYPSTSYLFPTAESRSYLYAGKGYTATDTLEPGFGYWLKFNEDQSVSIYGNPLTTDTIQVVRGWNIIGSVSDPIPVTNIASNPQGIIASAFIRYDGGYTYSDTAYPGQGYWVKCSTDGEILIPGTESPNYHNWLDQNGSWRGLKKLLFTDATNKPQSLYFSIDSSISSILSQCEIPPNPPSSQFRAAFYPDLLTTSLDPRVYSNTEIVLTDIQYPLTISWDVSDNMVFLSFNNTLISLVEAASISVTTPLSQMHLIHDAPSEGPKSLSLRQNYPNPFNSNTVIEYSLPVKCEATIVISNTLGQVMRSFSLGEIESGVHRFIFDGTLLSTGIYFYELITNLRSLRGKMMHLK